MFRLAWTSSVDVVVIGIDREDMQHEFKGECIYQAELDVHFPELTVGETLAFAAEARAPTNRVPPLSRKDYAKHMSQVMISMFNLSPAVDTKIGNDMIRGISGGERKRVSIAEAFVGGSPFQCWDNCTRGLDSSTALNFVRALRLASNMSGTAAVVSVYQASQAIYDVGFAIELGTAAMGSGAYEAL